MVWQVSFSLFAVVSNVSQTKISITGLSGLGMGSGNFMEMQQNMQRELLSNPDTLRQMMDNPLVQSLMSNPDYMRQILTSNPQMQQLLEVKPVKASQSSV